MSTLSELGLSTDDGPLMLIAPPDNVLAEAGRMKPRPSIASTLQVGEPTARIAWWVERRFLNPASLSRLHWMLQAARGHGWILFDPEEDELSEAEVREALAETQLAPAETRALANGEVAIRVAPAGAGAAP